MALPCQVSFKLPSLKLEILSAELHIPNRPRRPPYSPNLQLTPIPIPTTTLIPSIRPTLQPAPISSKMGLELSAIVIQESLPKRKNPMPLKWNRSKIANSQSLLCQKVQLTWDNMLGERSSQSPLSWIQAIQLMKLTKTKARILLLSTLQIKPAINRSKRPLSISRQYPKNMRRLNRSNNSRNLNRYHKRNHQIFSSSSSYKTSRFSCKTFWVISFQASTTNWDSVILTSMIYLLFSAWD